jgi:hypothetical protein
MQTSTIIANCRDTFEMNRALPEALPGSTVAPSSSSGALWASLRGAAGIHRGSAIIHRVSTVGLPAVSYPGSSLVCAGRATVLPLCNPGRSRQSYTFRITRITPVISNILFHPGSIAGFSRIIPDVADRVTDVLRLFPVVPRSYPCPSRITPDVYRGYARMLVRLQL